MDERKRPARSRPIVDDARKLLGQLVADYTSSKQSVIMRHRRGQITRQAMMDDVDSHILMCYNCSDAVREETLVLFEQYLFGYSYLAPLLDDPQISDIHCVAHDRVYVKRKGVRELSDVRFADSQEYRGFVDMVAVKNQVSISNLNAIQRFTDNKSDDRYILRFTVTMPIINTYDEPYLHIRKTARDFPMMDDLVEEGMMDGYTRDMLIERFSKGSTLICGGNSSGKTTVLNALKETLPNDMSVMVVQQSDELTSKSCKEMMFLHSLPGTNESDISYDLDDLAIAGLTMDVDFMIVGEIKGLEAKDLLKASYSGQLCAGTLHAPSERAAFDKIVDYAMMGGTTYTKYDLMKMLASSFSTIIYMKGYKVERISRVDGWDEDKHDAIYTTIFDRTGGGGADAV